MSAWDKLEISEDERQLLAKAGMGTASTPLGQRAAVIVVDVNEAFVYDEYPTADAESARPAVRAIGALLGVARDARLPIFYTTGVDASINAARGLWRNAYGRIDDPLLSRPQANAIVPEVAPRDDEVIIRKARPSAFWGTGLVDMLIYHHIDTVVVTGLTTGGCVRATVVDAFSHNFRVLVPAECVADRGERTNQVHLFDMHMRYAEVWALADVLEYLQRCRLAAGASKDVELTAP